ncbi:HAD family phosphatase [soil metagenome]
MPAPQAVLFDFDGVIADTENVHVAAWERTFGALGWEVAPDRCARAAEIDDRAFLAEVCASEDIVEGDIDGWCLRKQALTAEMLADEPRLFPGVSELIRALADRGIKLAVVSTTWRENIEIVLKAGDLAGHFKGIVGKQDVPETKPDPASYRLALRRLKVAAKNSVALEDSPTGLAAAKGASLRVVAVGHRRPPGAWAEGVPFLEDLSDLPGALATLGFEEG